MQLKSLKSRHRIYKNLFVDDINCHYRTSCIIRSLSTTMKLHETCEKINRLLWHTKPQFCDYYALPMDNIKNQINCLYNDLFLSYIYISSSYILLGFYSCSIRRLFSITILWAFLLCPFHAAPICTFLICSHDLCLASYRNYKPAHFLVVFRFLRLLSVDSKYSPQLSVLFHPCTAFFAKCERLGFPPVQSNRCAEHTLAVCGGAGMLLSWTQPSNG
jgi:hypothetical protein